MPYSIEVKPAAYRTLAKLEKDSQTRVAGKIEKLAGNPRPQGAEKLREMANLYRIRMGDYGIIYQIQDDIPLVLIIQIGHRREIYR